MKKIKNKLLPVFLVTVFVTLLYACEKKLNDYAPEKPFGGYTNSKQIAPTNLVTYWSFNGSLVDSVGNLSGTNTGTTFTAGKKGQALQVGANNYILFSNPGTTLPNLQAYTISFWMNAPQNTSYGYGIFSLANTKDFWGNLDIYCDNGSTADTAQFRVHMNNGNAKNPGKFLAVKIGGAWGKWIHIAVTYDSSKTASTSNFSIYANGNSVYSSLLKDTTNNYGALKFVNATAMVLGTWQFQTNPSLTTSATSQSWAGSLNGALDEFRIYNRSLTTAEVNSLYKLEAAGDSIVLNHDSQEERILGCCLEQGFQGDADWRILAI